MKTAHPPVNYLHWVKELIAGFRKSTTSSRFQVLRFNRESPRPAISTLEGGKSSSGVEGMPWADGEGPDPLPQTPSGEYLGHKHPDGQQTSDCSTGLLSLDISSGAERLFCLLCESENKPGMAECMCVCVTFMVQGGSSLKQQAKTGWQMSKRGVKLNPPTSHRDSNSSSTNSGES